MKAEIKIGIVVTLSIAILIWGISYLKGNNLFSKDNYFYAEYDNVQGLTASSPVMLNGYKVGFVSHIEFSEKHPSKLIVEFAVLNKYDIPKGTKAVIYSSDVMGTKAVKFEPGKSNKIQQDGDTLIAEIEADMISQFMPLKDKIEELVETVDTIMTGVSHVLDTAVQADIKQTVSNLNSASGSMSHLLASEKQRLKSIFSNLDSITSMFKNNSGKLSNAMANFSNISDSLAQSNLKKTIDNANTTLVKTSKIMEKINSGQGTMGALLHNDTLYHNLKNTTESLDLLLKDMKLHPKRYVHFSLFGGKEEKKK